MKLMRNATPLWLVAVVLLLSPTVLLGQQKPADKELPPPKVTVGSQAPDFTLKDQNGKDVSLHDFKGKKRVVLAFYVYAFTAG